MVDAVARGLRASVQLLAKSSDTRHVI
jgi:hypothetical protein